MSPALWKHSAKSMEYSLKRTGAGTCACHCAGLQFSACCSSWLLGKGGAHICHNAVTKQKPVMDVCFLVCTVPPFLPPTVALGLTLGENFHSWHPPVSPPPLQPVACSAVLGHKPHFPWRAIMPALGFAQSGASPGAWHAIVRCCKQKHTYTESIPGTAVPDGWQTEMLPGPNHLLQLGDRVPQRWKEAGGDWDLLRLFVLFCRIALPLAAGVRLRFLSVRLCCFVVFAADVSVRV